MSKTSNTSDASKDGTASQPGEATPKASPRDPVAIDLGLQGGGSHGAFTWGVLDRLLEESWLEIDAISGTSAGAMNATALVAGYQQGLSLIHI